MLEFVESTHDYLWNGQPVPGVTRLLGGLHSFAGIPLEVLETARERGSRVHRICQFHDEDDLDEADVQENWPEEWGYLQGWKKFLEAARPTWTAIERPLFHHLYRYAGMPDRMGEVTINGTKHTEAVVEIKTAEDAHPCWGIQLAAYSNAANKPKAPRFSVQLGRDGTFKVRQWSSPEDWPVFVSLATLHTWRTRHGL